MNKREYRQRRNKAVRLGNLCSNVVKNIIEHQLGRIPIEMLEEEMFTFLSDWIEEIMDENRLIEHLDRVESGEYEDDDDEFE